jgi:hypothetical protein
VLASGYGHTIDDAVNDAVRAAIMRLVHKREVEWALCRPVNFGQAVGGRVGCGRGLRHLERRHPGQQGQCDLHDLQPDPVEQGTGSQTVLLIGTDWTTGDTFPGGGPPPTHVDTQVALNGSHQQTGDTRKCATVSPYNDVIGLDANGMPTSEDHPPSSTSPTEAYALAKNVKDSAP